MRMIDADALERHVYTEWVNGELSNSEWVDFRQWLKDEPTVEPASPWHRAEALPEEDGWYILGYLSRWRDGNWWIPKFPDYWMDATPPKEDV